MADYIKVVVKPAQADNVSVRTGTTNGRDWRMASQDVWIFIDDDYPTEMTLQLPNDLARIEPGEYSITIDSIKKALVRGQYNRLMLRTENLMLVPMKSASTGRGLPFGTERKTA